MDEPNQKLIQYISRLTALTSDGSIPWYRANPTVFVWSSDKKLQVTLQEVATRQSSGGYITVKRSYLFQIQDSQKQSNSVAVDSKEKPEYQAHLQALYKAAQMSIDARAADILEDLLDGPA